MNNPDEYRDRNNKTAKKSGNNNPRKMAEQNEKTKKDVGKKLYDCQYRAETYNIEWHLTDMEAIMLFFQECDYCGEPPGDYFSGIDRVNNYGHYTEDNVVPACSTCNYMKGVYDVETFIKMCIHIATFQNMFDGKLFPEVFNNIAGSTYSDYKARAKRNKIDFEISKDLYNELIHQKCYLCDKNNEKNNGIDRVDSSLGYTEDNIKPCCNGCNILKGDLPLDIFLDMCKKIAENCYHRLDDFQTEEKVDKLQSFGCGKTKLNRNEKRKERNDIMINEKYGPDGFEDTIQKAIEAKRKKMAQQKSEELEKDFEEAFKDEIEDMTEDFMKLFDKDGNLIDKWVPENNDKCKKYLMYN